MLEGMGVSRNVSSSALHSVTRGFQLLMWSKMAVPDSLKPTWLCSRKELAHITSENHQPRSQSSIVCSRAGGWDLTLPHIILSLSQSISFSLSIFIKKFIFRPLGLLYLTFILRAFLFFLIKFLNLEHSFS